MSTFVNLGLISLNSRLNEIDIILNEAKANFETNEQLYNTLCRSAQVLLSAHFEGYLKDLVRNSLDDINHFSSFKNANYNLKKILCEHFIFSNKEEKKGKEAYNRICELISVFESLDTKFKKEYFTYNDNHNPKASVLDKIAEQFGIKDFFKQLKKSNLDLIFSNTNVDNIEICNNIKNYLLSSTENYPYNTELSIFEIDEQKANSDNLWDTFLSEFLKRRHDIAHGKEIDNSVGHSVIESDKVKIEILGYAFTAFICDSVKPIVLSETIE